MRRLSFFFILLGTMSLHAQNVGIGTATPATKLEVVDGTLSFRVGGDRISLRDNAGAGSNHYPYLEIRNLSGVRAFYLGWGIQGSYVDFRLENGNDLNISGGNVGIGTSAPTQPLHVAGNLRLDNAFMPGNNAGTTGQVLVSQGAGTAPVWQNPSWAGICASATADYVQKWTGTELCNTIIRDNGTAVGINAAPTSSDVTYVYRPSTNTGGGKSTLRAYRAGTSGATNGGTSWSTGSADVALKAYNLWGNNYTAALGAYGYTDYSNSAVAVFGDISSSNDTWIGYRDANDTRWGVWSDGIGRFKDRLFVEDPAGGGIASTAIPNYRFVVQTPGRPYMLVVDEVDTLVRIGRQNGGLTGDNSSKCLDGFTTYINYFVDIDGGTASGQVLGVGSVEYLVDGLNHLFVSDDFSPVRSSCSGSQPAVNLGATSNRWRYIYLQNSPNVSSDARLKKNIQNLSYGLNTIMKLRPVSYQWKDEIQELPDDRGVMLGFVAQELLKVVPEVVSTHHYEWTDENKTSFVKKENQTYGVHYAELIPVLVKAIQEQQQQIQELKAEVQRLKAEK